MEAAAAADPVTEEGAVVLFFPTLNPLFFALFSSSPLSLLCVWVIPLTESSLTAAVAADIDWIRQQKTDPRVSATLSSVSSCVCVCL